MDIETLPKLSVADVAEQIGITVQAVHKQTKANGTPLPKAGNKSYFTHDISRSFFRFPFEKKVISFQIVKGGTGKTTALQNIACAASVYGAKILAIDLDPQGNLTDAFNVNADDYPVMIDLFENHNLLKESIINIYPGIDLIPSRIENVVLDNKITLSKTPLHTLFEDLLYEIRDNYDYIFIDCPPTMGHTVSAATLYADTLLVPLNPDKFSAKGLAILKNEIKNLEKLYKKKISYRVFLNKYSNNTILSDKALQTTITSEISNGTALTTAIRNSQELPNSTDQDTTVFGTLRKSNARDDFILLTTELLKINLQKLARN